MTKWTKAEEQEFEARAEATRTKILVAIEEAIHDGGPAHEHTVDKVDCTICTPRIFAAAARMLGEQNPNMTWADVQECVLRLMVAMEATRLRKEAEDELLRQLAVPPG